MGSTRWSDDHYAARAHLRASTGTPLFAYDHDTRTKPTAEWKVNEKMDPKGVKFRESRDSDTHPTSHAVTVLFDVTGSMQSVPGVLQANLPKLMGLLIRKNYLAHPQIMIGGIGDATCDRAPLQVGQFESGIEIEEDLQKMFLEAGGGGQNTESYELAMYFLANHTSLDCFEKRGKRGYLFIIGDERPYDAARRHHIENIIGDTIQSDIPTTELMAELQKKYDVYFIIPKMTSHWEDEEILRSWRALVGQNLLKLEDPSAVCELIASTIGLAEGVVDMAGIEHDLKQITSTSAINSVSKALATVSRTGTVAKVPDSGAGSGIATL